MLEKFAERVAARYTAASNGVTFDPTLIITLLSLLAPLFQNCLANRSTTQVTATIRKPNNLQLAALLYNCRQTVGVGMARSLYDSILTEADKASDDEIAQAISESSGIDYNLF